MMQRSCGEWVTAVEEKSKVRRIPAIVLERFASAGAILRRFEGENSKEEADGMDERVPGQSQRNCDSFDLFLLFPGVRGGESRRVKVRYASEALSQ
jgi:hypothetical protein